MMRRITDVTSSRLKRLARRAWSDAANEALGAGQAVLTSANGRLLRVDPAGKIVEDLGPVASLEDEAHAAKRRA